MSSNSSRNASEVLDRLKSALNIQTDTQLAQVFDLRQNTISSWRSRNTLNDTKIIALCDSEGLSLDWVYSLQPDSPETSSSASIRRQRELEEKNRELHANVTALENKIEGMREALRLLGGDVPPGDEG